MEASNQSYYWRPTQNLNVYSGDVSQGSQFSNNSTSSVSFSTNGSPVSPQDFQPDTYHSPDYNSHVTGADFEHDVDDLQLRLNELETAMLGTDEDFQDLFDVSSSSSSWRDVNSGEDCRIMKEMIARGDLKQVLHACAKAVAEKDMITAEWLISMLRPLVSVGGEPEQRLGAYMLEGLVAKLSASGSFIYKSLRCKEPTGPELFSYMHLLYEACPYFKFGYLSANGAIAEAMKNEDRIHIIDFQIAQGGQWASLIQALAAQPGGSPLLRITGIDDSRNAYARGGGLEIVGQRLTKLAEACKLRFEFQGLHVSGSEIEAGHFRIEPGEALAVNCAFVLHHMPDESVDPQNHRDRLLRMIKGLSPKVVTLVEQEANVNTAPFLHRFGEAWSYYSAMFESIDVTVGRDHKDRINVEQHCLAGEIVNIIACEGAEREERHELLGKWRSRFAMAGFSPYPLSSYVNATIKTLLDKYHVKYRLEERDGALFLGWMNRDLVSSCAWKC